jgi:hypothetical protein
MRLFLLVSLALAVSANRPLVAPYVQEFSCGHHFYRTLHLDERNDVLYVGGMDKLFKLSSVNVSRADCERDSMALPPTGASNCVSKGKSEHYDCRNHIRVIQAIDNDRIYICGTNAHAPKDHVIYRNLTHLARHEFFPGVGDGIAKCPFDPEDNSTAIWVESGNPGGHPAIYSGTNAEFTKADTVIFRGDIFDVDTGRREYSFKRTIKYDSHMLDKPDFVGSYDIGEYVYFFFRETAVEYMNCGKTVYSRIARVCKRDMGGKNILMQNWATYLKARLNCSLPGEFPFFFNEIQDVFKSPDDDSEFHAVFTTMHNGLTGSAICTFSLEDVEAAFEGKFKEQSTTTSIWLPVPVAKVPEPRPGRCVDDTRKLSDTVLNFMRKHPLMDTNVRHDTDGPAFYERDVMFTKIVVDSVKTSGSGYATSGKTFSIYYAGTEDGRIYKISRWTDNNGRGHSKLLDVFDATSPDPIRAMKISRQSRALYVSSDRVVKQISLELCGARYENCLQCVRDPYCGWDGEAGLCRPRHFSLLQDPAAEAKGICEMSTPENKVVANFGAAVHMPCEVSTQAGEQHGVTWYHYDSNNVRTKVRLDDVSKYVKTQDHGLVILGALERDSGLYVCQLGKEAASSHRLSVDAHRCAAPDKTGDYQKAYSQWCSEYQKYRSALKSWEERQNKCASAEALFNQQNQVYKTSPFV